MDATVPGGRRRTFPSAVAATLTLALCLPFLGGGSCFPFAPVANPDLPPEARCNPSITSLSDGGTLEVQAGSVSDQGVFTPWTDGARTSLIAGGQGGQMVPLYLRIVGAGATCALVEVQITADAFGADLSNAGGYTPPPSYAYGGFTLGDDGTSQAILMRVDTLAYPVALSNIALHVHVVAATPKGQGSVDVTINRP